MAFNEGQIKLERGQAAADFVVDVTSHRAAFQFDRFEQMIRQRAQLLLRPGQSPLGRTAAGAAAGGVDGVGQCGAQAGQTALDEIVIGAGPHGRNGGVLADHAGDDDEGQIGRQFALHAQCVIAGEAGQVVVGNNGVPMVLTQGYAQRYLGFDPFADAVKLLPGECCDQQLEVGFHIFDHQDSQRFDAWRLL